MVSYPDRSIRFVVIWFNRSLEIRDGDVENDREYYHVRPISMVRRKITSPPAWLCQFAFYYYLLMRVAKISSLRNRTNWRHCLPAFGEHRENNSALQIEKN